MVKFEESDFNFMTTFLYLQIAEDWRVSSEEFKKEYEEKAVRYLTS